MKTRERQRDVKDSFVRAGSDGDGPMQLLGCWSCHQQREKSGSWSQNQTADFPAAAIRRKQRKKTLNPKSRVKKKVGQIYCYSVNF